MPKSMLSKRIIHLGDKCLSLFPIGSNEPGYPASPELLETIAIKEQELENFRLTICAEVEGQWQKGYRKELGDSARMKMEE